MILDCDDIFYEVDKPEIYFGKWQGQVKAGLHL